jgi:5'-nucleotidase
MARTGFTSRQKRGAVGILATVALGTALLAPLATSSGTASAVTITGAQSLADKVAVQFKEPQDRTTDVHVLAFNDLHGTLEPAGNNIYGRFAGGAAYLAKAVKDRQAQHRDKTLTVFAGDNIGASPLSSALFHDEPITMATNLMHVDFGSVGNHEFDEGKNELLRMQNGGCHPIDGCQANPYTLADGSMTDVYPGADFQYLAANVIVDATGQTLFPAYGTKQFKSNNGKKFEIGVIGEVLEATPTIVTPAGVAGLTFLDEADAANKAVKELQAKGVTTSILVIHQGGFQQAPAALNGCAGNLAGSDIAEIASRLDPAIKVIVSAHTHAEYRCTISVGGVTRLITSASSFGRILSDITLTIDDKSGELTKASAANVITDNALNTPGPNVVRQPDPSREDPAVQALVDQYVAASAPLANQVIGKIQGDLTRTGSPQGESTLGDVIADAQLVATTPADKGGAVAAFMNPGGIRADMLVNAISSGGEAPGEVTYGEAFTVQPFGNTLVTKTMTGDMIRRVLQQQFPGCAAPTAARILQVSSSVRYEQSQAAATCEAKIGRIFISGVEVQPTDSFRITMNNFLASGGDGFTVFNEGTSPLGGDIDLDALVAAFKAAGAAGIAVPPLNRIVAKP